MFRFLLAFAFAVAVADQVGQCGAPFSSPCGHIDVEVSVSVVAADFDDGNELYLVQDLDFDAWGINHVTAIEQQYEANCLSADCSSNEAEHVSCTEGVADVWVNTFGALPNFDGTSRVDVPAPGGQIAVQLFPGDKVVNFNNGEGTFARFGGATSKKHGQIVIRVVRYTDWTDGARTVTLRFHTACPEAAVSQDTYVGYLAARAYPAALVGGLDVPQVRNGMISVDSVKALLKREKAETLNVWAAGVYGHLVTSATLWKVDITGRKVAIATTAPGQNVWNHPHLQTSHHVVSAGDFFQWTCTYSNTEGEGSMVESGASFNNFACDIALVFSNSRCGGVEFNPQKTTPTDCTDPLFVDASEDAPEQVHLVYNWHKTGACSDGSQWEGHPYSCTDQYGGGKCAFCVGRANNIESRTCMDRQGMECPDIFGSPERKAWCNMEFECPASTVSFSLAMILAFVTAFLFN